MGETNAVRICPLPSLSRRCIGAIAHGLATSFVGRCHMQSTISDTLHRRLSRGLDRYLVRLQASQGEKRDRGTTGPFSQDAAPEKTVHPVCSSGSHAAYMGPALLRDFNRRLSAWARPLDRMCRAGREYLLDHCPDYTEACGRKGVGAGKGKSAGARARSAFIWCSFCINELCINRLVQIEPMTYALLFTRYLC